MSAPRPSPKCLALLRDVSLYLDGELPATRRRAVEAHVRSCTCCGTMAHRLRTVVAACRAEGRQAPPGRVMRRASMRVRDLLKDVRGGPAARHRDKF